MDHIITSPEYAENYLLRAMCAKHYSDERLAKELATVIVTRDTTPTYMTSFYKTICGAVDALRAETARREVA